MKVHKLKIHPAFFEAVLENRKTFEIRKNDRDYQLRDVLVLQEYNADKGVYTGRECKRRVTYILDDPRYLPDGYVALGIESVDTPFAITLTHDDCNVLMLGLESPEGMVDLTPEAQKHYRQLLDRIIDLGCYPDARTLWEGRHHASDRQGVAHQRD